MAMNLHVLLFDIIAQNIGQGVRGDDDGYVLPSLLRMLMLSLTYIALAFEEEL